MILQWLARKFREQVRLAVIELGRAPDDNRPLNYARIAREQAAHDSARFLLEHLQVATDYLTNQRLLSEALKLCSVEGLILEFGVFEGTTIRQIAATTKQEVHGFDSFEGLPGDWTHFQRKGRFSTGGKLPQVPANVALHKGWFNETLPGFLEIHPGPVRFLHIDSDLYSSAATALSLLEARIAPGTVIVFDELLNYPGWQRGEHRAWSEFVARTGVKFRWTGFASGEHGVCVVVS